MNALPIFIVKSHHGEYDMAWEEIHGYTSKAHEADLFCQTYNNSQKKKRYRNRGYAEIHVLYPLGDKRNEDL